MKLISRQTKNAILFGGVAAWSLLVVACATTAQRTMVAPPKIAGANFVGAQECTQCHAEQTDHFAGATHSRLALNDVKVGDIGCEACHGPASIHLETGGARGTIVNPRQSPETCFQCHLDKRGQMNLPHAHPVMDGQVSCSDCHDPHEGNAVIGGGVNLATANETCTSCHTQVKGPFIFEHPAMQEGCTACHNPHGSVNDKMLVARDDNLCLRCHLEVAGKGQIIVGGSDHASRLRNGTCWSAGCHEAPHGSNANNHFRY